MMSGIDDSVDTEERPRPQPNTSTTAPVDSSITIPTPATEHAPKGYIIDDSRGTIFWEAESDEIAQMTRDPEDEGATTETTESDAEQQQQQQQQNLGHPFKVQWLSTEKLPFHRARGLRNILNQNREVKIARDGTPIEPSTGRKLINLFHTPQVAPPSCRPPQMMYTARNQPLPSAGYPLDPRFARHY